MLVFIISDISFLYFGESEGTLSLDKMSGILLRRNYSLLGELAAVAGGEAYCHTTLVCRQPAAHACFHYR